MLERLARFSYTRRRLTVVLWILALVGSGVLASAAGGPYASDFSLPGTESQSAYDLLTDRFPARSGDTADLVFKADAGVSDPAVRNTMTGLFADVAELDHVVDVVSPYDPAGQQQTAPDGQIAFATVQFDVTGVGVPLEVVQDLKSLSEDASGPGLQIEPGGAVVQQVEFEPPGGAEAVGLLAAVLILLIMFGSVLAMGLPIMSALFGIGIGLSLVLLLANFMNVPNFTPQMTAMISIGVGIDYALFIVTRYRSALRSGSSPEESVMEAMTTSGRAVVFAGITVMISFLGMLLMGFDFIEGLAVGGAAAVGVTMLASISLLPAVLGFVGTNIDKFRVRKLDTKPVNDEHAMWFRWSRVVQRRPGTAAIAGLAILITLTIPLFSIRLGSADAGNNPETASSRRAYDLLSTGFGPGFNGPFLLAANLGSADVSSLEPLVAAVSQTDGVAAVTPPVPNPEGDAAVITVFPASSPQDEATDALVHRLRDDVVPQATAGSGTQVFVGGLTPSFVDFSEQSADRLPTLIGVVILLSFLLLMVVFRSLLVPLKAAIVNLLSIGAAYGVIVAVFQWGWLKDIVGISATGPIEAWVPMMLFAILFGLSMDYEIFLLSRIREEYLVTKDNGLAVANGLASTARVITAAAAIMVAVFLSFVIGFDLRQIKLFGLGLAVAIFVDATLVRMVLVPATMELLGDANWWLPRWLKNILPDVSIEGPAREPVVQEVG